MKGFPFSTGFQERAWFLEKRLSFENSEETVQEKFEKKTEGTEGTQKGILEKIATKTETITVSDGKIEKEKITNALTAIDTAAFETLKETFQKAGSSEVIAIQRARQAMEGFLALAPPVSITNSEVPIDKYFADYLGLFEKYNTAKSSKDGKNMLDGENMASIPPDITKWMDDPKRGYKVSLNNANGEITKKLDGMVKRNGEPFNISKKTSIIEQTGKDTLVFETGIKDIRPITLDGKIGSTVIGCIILDGDGDMTKIDEHGVSYVDSASLEDVDKKENIVTTSGLLKGYRVDSSSGAKIKKDVGTEGLTAEEREYKEGNDTYDGEKVQKNTAEAVKQREIENLPSAIGKIFGEILKDPEKSSDLLKKLIPLFFQPDFSQMSNKLRENYPVLPEIKERAIIEKIKADTKEICQDFLVSVIGILPKTLHSFPTGAIEQSILPKEKQRKAMLLLANELTGGQYDLSRVPEVENMAIKQVDGKNTLAVKFKDKGEVIFADTNVKFGSSVYEYVVSNNKNPKIKEEIGKIFSATPAAAAPIATPPNPIQNPDPANPASTRTPPENSAPTQAPADPAPVATTAAARTAPAPAVGSGEAKNRAPASPTVAPPQSDADGSGAAERAEKSVKESFSGKMTDKNGAELTITFTNNTGAANVFQIKNGDKFVATMGMSFDGRICNLIIAEGQTLNIDTYNGALNIERFSKGHLNINTVYSIGGNLENVEAKNVTRKAPQESTPDSVPVTEKPETGRKAPTETEIQRTLRTELAATGINDALLSSFFEAAAKDKTIIPSEGLYVPASSKGDGVDKIQEECDALLTKKVKGEKNKGGKEKYNEFIAQHKSELDAIQKEYNVPKEILVVQTEVESQSFTDSEWLSNPKSLPANPLFTAWHRYRLLSAKGAGATGEIEARRIERMQTEVENIAALLKYMKDSKEEKFSIYDRTSNIYGAMGTPQTLAKHRESIQKFDESGNIVPGTFTDIGANNPKRAINGLATMAQIHAKNMGEKRPFAHFEKVAKNDFTAVIKAFRTFDEGHSPVGFGDFYKWMNNDEEGKKVKGALISAGVTDSDLGYIKAMVDTMLLYNKSTKYALSILSAARTLRG